MEIGSRNVYLDLAFENPRTMALKADLAILLNAIAEYINDCIASEFRDSPEKSIIEIIEEDNFKAILKGHFEDISLEVFLDYFARLNYDISVQAISYTAKHKVGS